MVSNRAAVRRRPRLPRAVRRLLPRPRTALALGAIVIANRASTDGARTYGLYRLEILASLANALLLFAVAGYVLVEGVIRLVDGAPDVEAGAMLVVAVAGLAVNAIVFMLLRDGARSSLAVKSAALEALADAVGSVGVIVAAVVVVTTGWEEADAVIADLRRRDAERLSLEIAGGRFAGRELMFRNTGRPAVDPTAPFVQPQSGQEP